MAQRNPVESSDVRPKLQESKSWFFKLRYLVFLEEMLVLLKARVRYFSFFHQMIALK